jgi:metallo-beta-lactamase family protein
MEAGDIPSVPIFIDSPLATRASEIFEKHAGEIQEGDALKRALHARQVRFTNWPALVRSVTFPPAIL